MRSIATILLLATAACAQNGASVEVRCNRVTHHVAFEAWLWPGGQHAVSDEQGTARFAELSDGDYRLEIVGEGCAPVDTSFNLLSGEDRVIDVALVSLSATLPDVLVQTERFSRAVQTFTRKDFERSSAPDLAEFLAQQSGLDIRSEGVTGAVKTVRIGGSNANQVLLLVDGIRWQDRGSATADLSSIPLNWIERVDVYRGSRTESGGEGIGGVIQIETRTPKERNELSSEATIRETSQVFSTSREHKVGGVGGLISYSRTQGPNDFRYRISEEDGEGSFTRDLGKSFRRQNGRLSRDQLLVKVTSELGSQWSGWLSAALDRSRRGMPGFLAPMLTRNARQETAQSVVNAQATRVGTASSLRLRMSYQDDWKHYADFDSYALVPQSEERSRSAEAEATGQLRRGHSLTGYGASGARESIAGNNLGSNTANRNRWAVWSTFQRMFAENRSWGISGNAGVRVEGFGASRAILPKAGISATSSAVVRGGIDIAWGRSYRAPDFYELFWQADQLAVGNPELKPERSSEWTAHAFAETPWVPSNRLEVNGSLQRVVDLIYWHRSFDDRWKPLNVKAANVRTAGISMHQAIDHERWVLTFGTDWTDARDATDDRNTGGKYLTFRPLYSQRSSVTYRNRGFSGEVRWRGVSARPILETNSKWLKSYQLVDAQLGYAVRIHRIELEPQIGVNNLLNENYRIIRFVPMPLREWYLTVRMRTL